MVSYLPSILKVLGSIPITENEGDGGRRETETKREITEGREIFFIVS